MSAASPASSSPATHWPAVLVAALAGVAAAMNVGKVPVSLPLMRAEFGLTLVQAGWVSSMLTTLAVFSAMGVGLLGGRVGALRMVIGGLVMSAAGSLMALGATGFIGLLASRVIEGAGFLFVVVAGPALISVASAPQDRRFALSVWSSYMPAGAGLAMALAPLLLPAAGWHGLWLACAAVLLLGAGLAWQQRRAYAATGASSHPVPALRDTLAVVRQPLPWLLAFAFGAWALQHFALIIWLPTFLKEQRGLPAGTVAWLTCLMLLVNVPGNLIGGQLVQRGVPRGRLIALAHGVTGLAGWFLFQDSLPDGLRYGLCLLLSFSGGVIPAAVMSSSTVLARTPQQIGAIQGLIMQASQLGQFVGTPLIASVVAASGQWQSARWVTGGAALIGIVLGAWSIGIERRLVHTAQP